MKRVRSWAALYLTGAAVGSLLVCRSAFLYFGPSLLLNLTPSLPKGIYRIVPIEHLERGEIVAFKPPKHVYSALGKRAWLDEENLFIKPIGALAGDSICRSHNTVAINDGEMLPVWENDSQGIPLPSIEGCKTVRANYFVPVSSYLRRSFDGRYFGPIPVNTIVGEAKPVFTW